MITTTNNPTGVMKDEEKTRKKQGEKGTDKWCRNYERHIDLTGWSEFVCAEELVSSHSIKRFFNGFSWPRIWLFRRLLQGLFIWRMNVTKPDVIELHIDTMVMDNDEAEVRHGVEPTYKEGGGVSAAPDDVGTIRGGCGVQGWKQAVSIGPIKGNDIRGSQH